MSQIYIKHVRVFVYSWRVFEIYLFRIKYDPSFDAHFRTSTFVFRESRRNLRIQDFVKSNQHPTTKYPFEAKRNKEGLPYERARRLKRVLEARCGSRPKSLPTSRLPSPSNNNNLHADASTRTPLLKATNKERGGGEEKTREKKRERGRERRRRRKKEKPND